MEEVVKEVTPEVTPEVKEVTPETKGENMIPKSRFDEINSKYKEMAEKIEAFEKAEADRQKEAEQK
jgi:ribonucleoside-triphosphate reductase